MASIQRTKNGTWQVRYKDPSGRHRAKTYRLKADAQRYLHAVQTEIARGSYIANERGAVGVSEWVGQCLDSRSDLSVTTTNRDRGILRNHIAPRWSAEAISEVEHAGVVGWVKELLDAGQSVASVKKIVGVVSSAFDVAVRDRRVQSNPCRGIRYPKVKPRQKTYLSAEEVEEFADAASDDRQRRIVYVLAYCGLRWGEIAGLRVQDFDPTRRRFNIEQTIVDDEGKLLIKAPKNHEFRSVPVPKFLAELVGGSLAGKMPGDLIFTSVQGAPLRNRNERRRWFDGAAESIGRPNLTPHAMRHTAASMAISAGASVLSVQRMLGHESAAITLNVYSSLFEDDLDEVGMRLDSMRADARLRDFYAPASSVNEL